MSRVDESIRSDDAPVRQPVLGVGIDLTSPDRATGILLLAAREGKPVSATALAVHGVMTGWRNPGYRSVLARMGLVLPDGQPVRWALNWLFGAGLEERVYGPGLMLDICEGAAAEGLSIFLYGNTTEVLERLAGALKERFPSLTIAGLCPSAFGPLDRGGQEAVAGRLKESGAAICFVGTGCPRQEVFAERMAPLAGMPLVAVGAAFDFHAGTKSVAPRWMQETGLEWLFRLSREPRRLWRRYLFLNPAYLVLLAGQRLGLPVARKGMVEVPAEGPIPG